LKKLPQDKYLDINGVKIPVIFKKSSRGKLIRFSLNHQGLTVTCPHWTTNREIRKAIKEKEDWIYKHYKDAQDNQENSIENNWLRENSVSYLGEDSPIYTIKHNKTTTSAEKTEEGFYLYIEKDISEEDYLFRKEYTFKKLFKIIARSVLTEKADYYSKITGYSYNDIRIKEQKTMWASCSSKRNLNFNWKLITLKEELIDYVILHEICHLKHMNHSKDFWKTVEKHMPDYKTKKKTLKNKIL
jgi:predicted metal-dependent hydrolase